MDNNAVLERFRSWIAVQGLSQARAAKLCSCSAATLSQVLSGKYAGDTARIVEKMERVLGRDERKSRAPKRPEVVMTSVCEEVLATLRTAHDEGVMACIMGPSGVGKTSAVNLYCKAEPETILITIRPNGHNGRIRSSRPLVSRIAHALGVDLASQSSNEDWIEAVGEALKEAGRLLIIDEIDYADENLLQCLRNLHDIAGRGLVMVATPAFLERLRRKNSSTLNQFLSRIAYCCIVDGLTDEDAEQILKTYALDRTALAAAREGAHGVARRLVHGIIGAQRLAGSGKNVDSKIIARAYSMLMEA